MAGHPRVKEILDEVWEIHQTKNQDYSEAGHVQDGDVFSNFRACNKFKVDTLSGVLVRMSDKWERCCNLHAKGGEHAVAGESRKDAFLDLIGYAAIYLSILEEEESKVMKTQDKWFDTNPFYRFYDEAQTVSEGDVLELPEEFQFGCTDPSLVYATDFYVSPIGVVSTRLD